MIYLIDTNILIDHLRGESRASQFLLEAETGKIHAAISVITEYELLAVPHLTSHQSSEIAKLLTLMPRLAVTSRIAHRAAELRRHHSTINIADALIAATAQLRRAVLVTRNIKDFRILKGLRLHSV